MWFSSSNVKGETECKALLAFFHSEESSALTRAYAGCRLIEVMVDGADHAILTIEEWDSKDDFHDYIAMRQRNGTLQEIGLLLREAVTIRLVDFESTGGLKKAVFAECE